jgi:hypothetical protein
MYRYILSLISRYKTWCLGEYLDEGRIDSWYINCMLVITNILRMMVTDWKTRRSRFDPLQRRKDFSSSLCVQTGSEAHPVSCTMGTGGPFPEGKARPGRDADHPPYLVSRSRMSRNHTSSPPKRFHGVLWDSFSYYC